MSTNSHIWLRISSVDKMSPPRIFLSVSDPTGAESSSLTFSLIFFRVSSALSFGSDCSWDCGCSCSWGRSTSILTSLSIITYYISPVGFS